MYQFSLKKILSRIIVGSTAIILSGCGGTSETNIHVGNLSFDIPNTFQSISSQSLDSQQIAHSILAARKTSTETLILSESTLPSTVSIKEFSEKASKRLSQEMIGYTEESISKKTYTCNGEKQTGYLHQFVQKDVKDATKIITYYDQFYFAQKGSVYILSLAQTQRKSIMNSIIQSLGCLEK